MLTACACAGVSSPLGALLHLLRSPSRALRQQGEEVLQQNYHLRPPGALQVQLAVQHRVQQPCRQCFSARACSLLNMLPTLTSSSCVTPKVLGFFVECSA